MANGLKSLKLGDILLPIYFADTPARVCDLPIDRFWTVLITGKANNPIISNRYRADKLPAIGSYTVGGNTIYVGETDIDWSDRRLHYLFIGDRQTSPTVSLIIYVYDYKFYSSSNDLANCYGAVLMRMGKSYIQLQGIPNNSSCESVPANTWYVTFNPLLAKGNFIYNGGGNQWPAIFSFVVDELPPPEKPENYPGPWIPGEGGGHGTGAIDPENPDSGEASTMFPTLKSDPIPYPEPPTISAVDTGFVTAYNPSMGQILELSSYLWNSDFFTAEFWKKIVANPMDCILGLSMLPCPVPDGGTKEVYVGYVNTGLSWTLAGKQFISFDCGEIDVKEITGSYLDYSPYTKCELYLPYCGVHPIDIDDVMTKKIGVRYIIDILTGACIAFVKCGDSVKYSFAGNCAVMIPITSANYGQIITSVIRTAVEMGATVASGGMTAPLLAQDTADMIRNAGKLEVSKSGNLSGASGYMGIQYPYLMFTHPNLSLPDTYKSIAGYPSNLGGKLGDYSGFTKVAECHMDGIACTSAESKEIENLIKEGIII